MAAHFDCDGAQSTPSSPRFRDAAAGAARRPRSCRTSTASAGQCFRGLRKLGMRDEVDQLLGQTAEIVLAGRSPRSAPRR